MLYIIIPYIILIIFIIVIISQLSVLLKIQKNRRTNIVINKINQELPYYKNEFILTKSELIFYKRLKPIAEKYSMSVFTKVRLCDIINVNNKSNNWQGHFNKIKSKHIDFLLCNNEYLQNKIAIELNDSSHNRQNRIERDNFIKSIFEKIKMPFLTVQATGNYIEKDLEKQICELCNIEIIV